MSSNISETSKLAKEQTFVTYKRWERTIEGLLEEENLWDHEKRAPIITDIAKDDRKAKRLIESTVAEEFLNELGEAETAEELFAEIWYRFQKRSTKEGIRAKKDFYSIEKKGLSIEKLAKKLRELATTVKVCLGESISESEKITILLLALPEEYASEALKIENSDLNHLEDALPMLIAAELAIGANTKLSFKTAKEPKQCTNHPHSKNHSTDECNYPPKRPQPTKDSTKVMKNDTNLIKYYTLSNVGMSGNSKDQWIMDSGASFHITNNIHEIKNPTLITNESVLLPNGTVISVEAIGSVIIQLAPDDKSNDPQLTLEEVRYIPTLDVKLLSEVALAEEGFEIVRKGNHVKILHKDGNVVATGTQLGEKGSMYTLDTAKSNHQINTVNGMSLQNAHESFGHISPERIIKMAKSGHYQFTLTDTKFMNCDACSATKLTTPPQPHEASRTETRPGEVVNADVIGPINEINPEAKYVSVLIDRATSYASAECMKTKDTKAIASQIEDFITTLGGKIELIRSDNGTEYTSRALEDKLNALKIKREFTAPHSPAQNGKVERLNRTLIEMTKSMLKAVPSLAHELWPYAIDYAVWLYNRIPKESLHQKSPFEALTGHCPDLSTCKPFGTECWFNPNPVLNTKAKDKGEAGIYLGHAPNSEAHLILTENGKVVTSRIVKFSTATKDLTDRHLRFYTNEKRRNEHQDEDDDSDEDEKQFTTGTKSRPTHHALLIRAIKNASPPLHKLLNDKQHGAKWKDAALGELKSLVDKGTFRILNGSEIPDGIKPISSGWVCKEKLGPNNEVTKHKVRLVARGYTQRKGEDFDETFAPVTDITEILETLTMAASMGWQVHQIDVKTAYLNAPLHHELYMRLPNDTPDTKLSGAVVKLEKALYGLKQAGFEWYNHLKNALEQQNFKSDDIFPCRFTSKRGNDTYIALVYVDDIIITGPEIAQIESIKSEIASHFEIEDLGELSYLLGMRIDRTGNSFHLDQEAMIDRSIEKFDISGVTNTPCSADARFLKKATDEDELADVESYQSKVGTLNYLSRYTRPDICYITNLLARFTHKPSKTHMAAIDRVFRYLKTTKTNKFKLAPRRFTGSWEIDTYTDADYADHSDSTESTSGLAIYLMGSLIAWESKRQKSTSLSTTESEYVAASNGSRKIQLINNFIETTLKSATNATLHCDNQSTIASVKKAVVPSKLKHINVKFHHIRDNVRSNIHDIKYVSTDLNIADIFTKGLPRLAYEAHIRRLGITDVHDLANVGVSDLLAHHRTN